MKEFVYVFTSIVYFFIQALQFCMLIRAVLSWFPIDEDNPILIFLDGVTEPLIYPVRLLLDKIGFMKNSPFDFSFIIAYLLLSIVSVMLGGGII